ncbi:trehalose 6-phosphate synthase [Streptomyces olivoverticillatus]|uniref:Trehalose 6-phosphate synthase n=1 Tax=Streptomyces olivoverticillatus TaxID=66427 RepID=A0A7W7PJA2_9ACTN|nr:trehalose-6-phosphate synthase [Streptomyces olivoverticillatus]MBB4891917.1 trehalose 6-phosphate synthase [Streptomyces olivoverticillatus]
MVAEHVHSAPVAAAPIVMASNRGPVSYTLREDGSLTAGRGGGGLVSGLSSIGRDSGAVWVCAALSDGDRAAARAAGRRLEPGDTGGHQVRMLDVPAATFAAAYNGIANSVLWFVHHMLYQTPLEPSFDAAFREQWAAYWVYNTAFAEAIAEEAAPGAAVLVQDYHLTLVPGLLRALRPDLRIGHFSHTPWAPPDYYRLLPDDVAGQVLRGILGGDRAGFLTERWAEAFAACCENVLSGAEVVREGGTATAVRFEGRTTRLGVHGLGADADFLRERAHQPDVEERMTALREQVGPGRRTIVRVDRTELSKNIVRGLRAYRRLLEERPQWRGKVVHIAFAYPSRQDLAVYRDYTAEVERVAREINSAFGTEGWQPVSLHVKDDFARSLAAYRLADVALVNPIRDGMNLVAKEVPVVSDHGCALVLSREAGAAAELGDDAIIVNPYDVEATARALHEALLMEPGERAERSKRLAAAATALPPARWFTDQLAALLER